jgi:hypothetical protein
MAVPVASLDVPLMLVAPAVRLPALSVVITGVVVKQVTVRVVLALMQDPEECAYTSNTSPRLSDKPVNEYAPVALAVVVARKPPSLNKRTVALAVAVPDMVVPPVYKVVCVITGVAVVDVQVFALLLKT